LEQATKVNTLAVMSNRTHLLAVLFLLATSPGLAEPVVATFSIVAADPESGEVGVGAVAIQAIADVSFGPRGLELLARGVSPEEIVTILLRDNCASNGD